MRRKSVITKKMVKLKLLLFLVVLLSSTKVFPCSCAPSRVTDDFQRAQFVAKVKILKVTQDSVNKDYHDAVVEMITLYKGEYLTKIKILSVLNSSCAFLPSVNSTWIVFASEWRGVLSFGLCSGSFQLDRAFDPVQYPNAAKNYGRSIMLKQQVIEYLSNKGILNPNPDGLYVFNGGLKTIKGYKNKKRFAVFQVDVNTDLSVAKIRVLKKFQNHALTKAVLNSMKADLKFVTPSRNPITKPTRMVVFCYIYENLDPEKSFVSLFDI